LQQQRREQDEVDQTLHSGPETAVEWGVSNQQPANQNQAEIRDQQVRKTLSRLFCRFHHICSFALHHEMCSLGQIRMGIFSEFRQHGTLYFVSPAVYPPPVAP
jgi:hypothetical protein